MPTPGERRALVFLAAIAALGVAVRGWRELRKPDDATHGGDRSALAHQIDAVDSAIAAGGARRRARDPQSVDRQSREPASKHGRTSPADEPPAPREPRREHSRADAAARATDGDASDRRRTPSRATESAQVATGRRPASWGARPPVDLDTATPEEIAAIPAIGPALARRIVADRVESGPFGSIDGLERVRGISRSLARRFQPYVTFSLAPRPERIGTTPSPPRATAKKRQPRPIGDARP